MNLHEYFGEDEEAVAYYRNLASAAVEAYGNSREAIEYAVGVARQTPLEVTEARFRALEALVISELVYRQRCVINRRTHCGSEQKRPFVRGHSDSVQEVAQASIFDRLFVAGRRVGDVLVGEAADIARNETAVAAGHARNARLMRWVASRATEDNATLPIRAAFTEEQFARAERRSRATRTQEA